MTSEASTRFEIRQAGMEDLEAATQLFSAYRAFYGQPENLPACHHFLFERILNNESVIYLALDSNANPVGFLQLYPSFTSIRLRAQWILNDLFVVPKARGQGVATALIEQAKQWVRNRKDDSLILSTAHSNQTAQRLYEALGFIQDTEFRVYQWSA